MEKITYKKIFFKFFGIGFMTIGGGYAMISLIEKELCKKKQMDYRKGIFGSCCSRTSSSRSFSS